MFSKFLNLKTEKQERILQAAIKEFADKGFESASTNEIVKEAGISKGILFHYFQNKKKLFLFVFDYCVEVCMDEFFEKVDEKQSDIFEKLRQIASFKLELLNKYPSIFKFIESAIGEECSEVKSEIEERKKELAESNYSKVFNNIDKTKFREGVDVNRAINIIMWTLDGFGTSELKKAKASAAKQMDYEKVFHEMDSYIDIFKNSFYK
ncbi:TetR/AcrR family transcriptional regulator [Clostridium bowmanii]|uniref:TetR/AcrR family transcriptional regulator n=1 Tax=Clostridium bowmanii TaxID=132925 RepID=UPI001C0DE5DF|nr:TetR/AcrR family transcriptional regulator [Clostridium bowmanii]MBU3190152.1 TetR/AcrR family transcriptional regulator [Clostridium bowmanii]MCA1074748.1 TetR/AcrR family transcriptional regulator [Clostridium bowmanii]